MSPSEAWRLLSAEDDQSVTTLSESYFREADKSTEARSQSSNQYEDANGVSTPKLRETRWGEASRNAFIADPEQEPTSPTQGLAEPFVKQERMSPPSTYLSETQTEVIRPDPFAVPEECDILGDVSPTSERTVVKQPPDGRMESFHPMLGSDVTSESCGCPANRSTASEVHASRNHSLPSRQTQSPAFQSPVRQNKSVIPHLVALLKRCAMEVKALRRPERIAAEPPQDQTQGSSHPLSGTNTMPEIHRSPESGLLHSEIPVPELSSDQAEDIEPAAFLRTPSADTQSPVPEPVAPLKRCSMESKAFRPSEKILAKQPHCQTRTSLYPLRDTDVEKECCDYQAIGLQTPERPVPKLPSYQKQDRRPPSSLGTPSPSRQLLLDNINANRRVPVSLLKRYAVHMEALRDSETNAAGPSRDKTRDNLYGADTMPEGCDTPDIGLSASHGPVPELPLEHAAHNEPPAFLGSRPGGFQVPATQVKTISGDPVGLPEECGMEAKTLRPSDEAEPPRDQTLDRLHVVVGNDVMPEGCGCPCESLASERPVYEPPSHHGVDNQPPEFQRTRPAALQVPVKQINSVSPDTIALLKRCAMEAKALHPSQRLVTEPPRDQIFDSSHSANDPAAMLESCSCQDSEMSLREMPFDEHSDNLHPEFLDNQGEASHSSSVVMYECVEEQRDASARLESSMKAYLYTKVWSSDAGTQSAESEDFQAYTEIELPSLSTFPFAPGTKLVQIGHNYWLAEPMGAAYTYNTPM